MSESMLLAGACVVPLFRLPDLSSEQVTQALLGMAVTVLESQAHWCRVRTPDGYHGWCQGQELLPAPSGWHAPWIEVEDLWAHFRCRDDYRLAAAGTAPVGTTIPVLRSGDDWTEALFPDGRRLWTESHRVRAVTEAPLRTRNAGSICATAMRFLGVPYLWGGTSPFGLDCSGFVQLVYRLHGLSILRDAHQQSEQGEPAPVPAATDLAFFGPDAASPRITHVGMMLDSERFVHASGGTCVRVNSLAEGRYLQRFRFARRYLPAE